MGRRAIWIGLAAGLAAASAGTAGALVPSDPYATHPSYEALRLPTAWELTTGAPGVVIAIVDSGVEASHPDLAGAFVPGRDFVDRDDDATDPPGPHGTAVAGVAAARGGNGFGGVGACFSCRLMPLRVLGLDGFALNTNIAAAIDYAVDHGAAVVNISLYGPHSPPRLREAIVRARAAGVLVVAAAGNEGTAEPQYPAAFPETIAVGAAATNEKLARSSSFGDWVDVAAPECAPLTAIGGATEVGCGTSVSAPLVAGIVGLMRAQAPFASAAQLEAALASTARPLDGVRHGFVDAAAALASLGSPGPSVQPVVFGQPATGQTLEAFTGLWSGAGLDVRYRWERCGESCVAIDGATSPRYVPTAGDVGQRLRVGARLVPGDWITSAQTAVVLEPPRSLTRPSIAGRPRVGAVLVARPGSWAGSELTYSVSWQRCKGACAYAAVGPRYRVRARDRGYRFRISVSASNAAGSVTAVSARTNRAFP